MYIYIYIQIGILRVHTHTRTRCTNTVATTARSRCNIAPPVLTSTHPLCNWKKAQQELRLWLQHCVSCNSWDAHPSTPMSTESRVWISLNGYEVGGFPLPLLVPKWRRNMFLSTFLGGIGEVISLHGDRSKPITISISYSRDSRVPSVHQGFDHHVGEIWYT